MAEGKLGQRRGAPADILLYLGGCEGVQGGKIHIWLIDRFQLIMQCLCLPQFANGLGNRGGIEPLGTTQLMAK